MQAKVKCSNCGAEITNLNFAWGKKQLLFMIPAMLFPLLAIYPLMRMGFSKGDIAKDLVISDVEKRVDGSDIEVLGIITNQSTREWTGIRIEAEFFDATGKFVDEESSYLTVDVQPSAKEHFKLKLHSADSKVLDDKTKMVVKIAGGHTSPF